MGEETIEYLKRKCNALIDKACQLEQEISEKNRLIEQLQLQKNAFMHPEKEEAIGKELDENVSAKIVSGEEPAEEKKETIYETIFDLMEDANEELKQEGNLVLPAKPKVAAKSQKSVSEKIMKRIFYIIERMAKFLGVVILMLLISLAITVLMNSGLRNEVLEFIKNCIG